jgi:RNA polymerase sigma-70 factor (ECF subfamily)
LAQADRNKGRLRSFLLVSLKHFLSDHWSQVNTHKRGHGKQLVSIDGTAAEERYALEPVDEAVTPDVQFERRWALTLLETVLGQLREDYESRGQGRLFRSLQRFLAWNSAGEAYGEVAEAFGMKESAVRVAIFRMRRRYGDLLRDAVAETVATPEEVAGELDYLQTLLRS